MSSARGCFCAAWESCRPQSSACCAGNGTWAGCCCRPTPATSASRRSPAGTSLEPGEEASAGAGLRRPTLEAGAYRARGHRREGRTDSSVRVGLVGAGVGAVAGAGAGVGAVGSLGEEGSHSGPEQMVAEAVRTPRTAGYLEARHRGWPTRE